MRAIVEHLKEIEKYQTIVNNSTNPYVINDYSKAIHRLKKELKTYCRYRGLDYKQVLK